MECDSRVGVNDFQVNCLDGKRASVECALRATVLFEKVVEYIKVCCIDGRRASVESALRATVLCEEVVAYIQVDES